MTTGKDAHSLIKKPILDLPVTPFPNAPEDASFTGHYDIVDTKKQETSTLLFARNRDTGEDVVIKVLSPYKDTRIELDTVSKRNECQRVAIRWNKKFASESYIGPALIQYTGVNQIDIEVRREIDEDLIHDIDHAIVMRELPKKRWLDQLLEENRNDTKYVVYTDYVINRIAYIHENELEHPAPRIGVQWGSCDQLYEKLIHNLRVIDHDLYWMSQKDQQLAAILGSCQKTLPQVFRIPRYCEYFEQRVMEGWIKHCHGDIKSANIWIKEDYPAGEQDHWASSVQILDAIDFEPEFYNIDVLSDLAMFIVDIQARTTLTKLPDFLINKYLKITYQDNPVAKSVLAYYLVEKALVCAMVNLAHDNTYVLGTKLLDVAENRLEHLKLLMEAFRPNP